MLDGIAAGQSAQNREVAGRAPGSTTPIRINILNPSSGSQSSVGVPVIITVHAIALGSSRLTALELWANGRLVGQQDGPAGAVSPLSARFAWTPTASGHYELVARAHDNERKTATSDAVSVLISASTRPGQSRESVSVRMEPVFANGTGGEKVGPGQNIATRALPEPPVQPDPRESTAPATIWKAGIVARRSPALVRAPPAAPELIAAPNGCGATLRIHDLSTNEDGFIVYRHIAYVSGWKRIATLSPQSTSRWLTFADKGYSGSTTYYVASFNSRGEAPGNLSAVDVNPADCPTVSLTKAGLSDTYTLNRGPVIKTLGGTGDGPQSAFEAFDPRMPSVMAHQTTNVEHCKEHLPSKGQNLLEAILFCTPFPEYAPAPQPYMWWQALDGLCANGKASEGADCQTVEWYRQRAIAYGGSLGYRLRYEYVDGPHKGLGVENVAATSYDRTVYVIPPLEPYGSQADTANLCGVKARYEAQLFYDAGPADPLYANVRLVSPQPGSADFTFNCAPPPPGQIAVDVTIDTLELDNVDDDDGGTEDVELYGSFQINTSSMATSPSWGIRNLATWASNPEGCPNELFTGGLEANATGECAESFTNSVNHGGNFNFKDLRLCTSESYKYCGLGPDETTHVKPNNTIRIAVKEGDAIVMHTTLVDYDSAFADDNICVGTISTANKSLDTWSKVDGVWTMVYSNPGNASCKMHFRLKAVKP